MDKTMWMPPAHPPHARAYTENRLQSWHLASCNNIAIPKQNNSSQREKYGSLAWLFGTLTVEGEVGVGGKGEVGEAEESEGEGREED